MEYLSNLIYEAENDPKLKEASEYLWQHKDELSEQDRREIEVFRRDNDVFRRPLHLTFDCEIMYGWTGEPDRADLPQVYSIDYFRYWKAP